MNSYTAPQLTGACLLTLRKSKNLSQQDIEDLTAAQGEGMTVFRSDYSDIENGKHSPTIKTLQRIVAAMKGEILIVCKTCKQNKCECPY